MRPVRVGILVGNQLGLEFSTKRRKQFDPINFSSTRALYKHFAPYGATKPALYFLLLLIFCLAEADQLNS